MEYHRKPLQPVNSTMNSTSSSQMKQKMVIAAGGSDNENGWNMGDSVAILRRKERMRVERLRTEEVLRERERELERGMREVERRDEELRNLELEIRKLMINRKSRQIFNKNLLQFLSLRAKEKKRRDS